MAQAVWRQWLSDGTVRAIYWHERQHCTGRVHWIRSNPIFLVACAYAGWVSQPTHEDP
jgi:hypothetical protein